MRLLLILFALAFAAVHLCSCNQVCSCKKVPCPAYNNALFETWFPYSQDKLIIFKTNAGDADTFLIDGINASAAYEANQGCLNGDNGCNANKFFYAANKMEAGNSMSFNWDGTLADSSYFVSVYDFSVNAKHLADTGFAYMQLQSQYYNQLQLDGKIFQQVQEINNADTSSVKGGISKMYIEKGKGIIGYEVYPSHILWVIQ